MLMARPKHRRADESTLAVDREAGEALVHRHQLDGVDVEVRRQGRDPPDGFGEVAGGHRGYTGVERVRRLLVAAGTDDGEFRLRHPGLDRRHPNPAAVKVAAQVEGELMHERLGPG